MFKGFLKRFKAEKGEVILTTLAVTGLIALGVTLFSFEEKAEQVKFNRVDITKYSDITASGDPGKDQEKNSAALVEVAVEGGKVGVYDDTGLLVILDKSGALKVKAKKDKKEENVDQDIKTELKKNGLPDDKLMVDVIKAIKSQVVRKSNPVVTDGEIDGLVYEIINEIEDELKALDDISEDDFMTADDVDIIDKITQSLEKENKLEHGEVVKLKKQLDRINIEKEYIEQKIASYAEYEHKGYIITDTSGLNNLKDRLEDLNKKIIDINGQINEITSQNENIEDSPKPPKEEVVEEEENKEEKEEKTKPTINLVVTEGPVFSEEEKVCYYRVTATVTQSRKLPLAGMIAMGPG